MSFRDGLTLRTKRHRQIHKWLFGAIFLVTLLVTCWLLS
jgi:hypothetical protein